MDLLTVTSMRRQETRPSIHFIFGDVDGAGWSIGNSMTNGAVKSHTTPSARSLAAAYSNRGCDKAR